MNNSFAAQHPELVCEWSERNLPLTPDRICHPADMGTGCKAYPRASGFGALYAAE